MTGRVRRQAEGRLQAAMDLLGVAASDGPAEVKRAYHDLVSKVHPDKLGPAATEEQKRRANAQTKAVREAYQAVLDALDRTAHSPPRVPRADERERGRSPRGAHARAARERDEARAWRMARNRADDEVRWRTACETARDAADEAFAQSGGDSEHARAVFDEVYAEVWRSGAPERRAGAEIGQGGNGCIGCGCGGCGGLLVVAGLGSLWELFSEGGDPLSYWVSLGFVAAGVHLVRWAGSRLSA